MNIARSPWISWGPSRLSFESDSLSQFAKFNSHTQTRLMHFSVLGRKEKQREDGIAAWAKETREAAQIPQDLWI